MSGFGLPAFGLPASITAFVSLTHVNRINNFLGAISRKRIDSFGSAVDNRLHEYRHGACFLSA
jgi:hypothetical protein